VYAPLITLLDAPLTGQAVHTASGAYSQNVYPAQHLQLIALQSFASPHLGVTPEKHTMRLTDIAARIFGKSKPQQVLPPLERSSTELTRARLTTRRNSLENSHFVTDYAHEELHTVCPR
jgi:hypothetical protein